MAGTKTFSCFITLLIILPTLGKSIRQQIAEDYERIVETNVKQILPKGMNASRYNDMVLSYWTPERMASAKPMDLLMLDTSKGLNTAKSSRLTMSDRRVHLQASIPGVRPKSLKAVPQVTGKLFGRMGSSNYVCSGSVIISENGDTVLTAGHCIWDGSTQSWASDIIFVPGYASGSSPYGRYVWRTMAAMNGWTQLENFNYDAAVVLVDSSDEGQHIQDVTGSLGMTINRPRQAQTDSYGYPVNIHGGQELASCTDEAVPADIPQLPDFVGVRLPCNMTGGSSGGPWTQESDYQTSVNSFGIVGLDDVMFGPYFSDAIYNLWDTYQKEE